jgi:hypothetical protein
MKPMGKPFKIGDKVQFRCWNDHRPNTWWDGTIEGFYDGGDMHRLKVDAVDLDRINCVSKWLRIKVMTGLWAEGYYYVLVMKNVPPGPGTDDIRLDGLFPRPVA